MGCQPHNDDRWNSRKFADRLQHRRQVTEPGCHGRFRAAWRASRSARPRGEPAPCCQSSSLMAPCTASRRSAIPQQHSCRFGLRRCSRHAAPIQPLRPDITCDQGALPDSGAKHQRVEGLSCIMELLTCTRLSALRSFFPLRCPAGGRVESPFEDVLGVSSQGVFARPATSKGNRYDDRNRYREMVQ